MAQPTSSEDISSPRAAASHATDQPTQLTAAAPSPRVPPSYSSASSFQPVNARPSADSARAATLTATSKQRIGATAGDAPRVTAAAANSGASKLSSSATASTAISPPPDASATMAADASYGTRSRNRTNARPNYAEDQDMDFEFSSTAPSASVGTSAAASAVPAKKKSGDASATVSAQPASNGKRVQELHNLLNASNGTGPEAGGATKKDGPASSASNATGTKKRKAAAAGVAAAGNPPSTSHTPPSSTPPPTGRKSAVSVQPAPSRETSLMTFTKHKSCLSKKGELVADDGTKLAVNDHVYLVCEPPGDPYYLCRIMEFLHVNSDNPLSPVDSIRVNWYYRPRDVQRFSSDTRLVFGTMHSDMCPITSLRGKCTIRHRSEIDDLDAYRKGRDSFYFVQVFDRFIRRSYECIPVQQIINVPERVKKALDERWKFVVVEIARVKELTSAAKTCKRCARYCASHDSVDCAICKNSYHMNCVQPPLPKKPSRGFAWACGPCSRAQERRKEARLTPNVNGSGTEAEEEEIVEEEEPPVPSNGTTRAPSPSSDDMPIDDHPATQAEIALAKMWPMRYLGIHARVEDALQYDDRAIYPRASSRLGPRHQANTHVWHGRPVELVKPAEIKKRYNKSGTVKKEPKLTKEALAAIEAEREERAKRPKWVQDEPPGYVARGEDYDNDDPRCTAQLLWKMPPERDNSKSEDETEVARVHDDESLDDYIFEAKKLSKAIGVPPFGTNFLDKAVSLLAANSYDPGTALDQLSGVDRIYDLHEPVLSKNDLIKFEEGVAKYGSEHRLIRLHMKTSLPHSDIVRFYYLWKKTPKGREIWGNYGGRKKRKIENDAGAKLQAEVAHDVDDSAFDHDKAARKHYGFQCKFCSTHHSRQWRRAPGVSPGQLVPPEKGATGKEKKERPLLALCLRCAGLWRKYAIQWEDIEEVAKKVAQGGGRAWKRKIDEELFRELVAANEAASRQSQEAIDSGEPPKKKLKADKDAAAEGPVGPKKKEKPAPPPKEPTPPPPPIIPAKPTWKALPCAVCRGMDSTVSCLHCKLTVHPRCFGLADEEGQALVNSGASWMCEQCQNDRNPVVSTEYACCLCLTEETQIDLVEPPRISHKKKTDREREKERLEKELADAMRSDYRERQIALNRPPMPREPLKRTTGNNWVHVYCAVWAGEIRFSNAKALEVAEGFQSIPQARFEAVCKLCKNKDHQNRVRENAGACINCFQCNTPFHASCAFEAGYQFGFDVTPVKGSRKDHVQTATLGAETGSLTAIVLCKEHVVKNIVHPINEVVDEDGTTALQVFVQKYRQADLALTGTVRKANLAQLTKDKGQQSAAAAQNANRRESTGHSIAAAVKRGNRNSSITNESRTEGDDDPASGRDSLSGRGDRRCAKCNIDVTPKWHPVHDVHHEPNGQLALSPSKTTVATVELDDVKPIRTADAPGTSHLESRRLSGSAKPQQNIRFMPPGTNGRAWDGMGDRYSSRSAGQEDHATVGSHAPGSSNGIAADSSTHASRPPKDEPWRYSLEPAPPGTRTSLHPVAAPANGATPQTLASERNTAPLMDTYLCHKCFLKKKLDPTPPPDEHGRQQTGSPRNRPASQMDGTRTPQSSTQLSVEQQFRLWDEPPAPPPPPPPPLQQQPPPHAPMPMNGTHGPPHAYGGHPPPAMPHAYPPQFAHPPNGYHAPHPPHPTARPGPHPMHERHNSFGFPHSQPSNGVSYPPPHPSSRPPPLSLNGYGPGIPNGVPSPHSAVPPPLHSPTFPPPGPQQTSHQMPPMRSAEPPYQSQLAPLGGPAHSSPGAPFGRPRGDAVNGQPHHAHPPPHHLTGPPPGHHHQQALPATSPRVVAARAEGQNGPQPTTPRGGPSGSGASASPNLMNLIH